MIKELNINYLRSGSNTVWNEEYHLQPHKILYSDGSILIDNSPLTAEDWLTDRIHQQVPFETSNHLPVGNIHCGNVGRLLPTTAIATQCGFTERPGRIPFIK